MVAAMLWRVIWWVTNVLLLFVPKATGFSETMIGTICGPKYGNGEWKSRTNRELEEMSKGENIVKWIRGQRVSWLGHLERMEEGRMSKKIVTQELEGSRKRGRYRKNVKRK
jgi:hypothetical protein